MLKNTLKQTDQKNGQPNGQQANAAEKILKKMMDVNDQKMKLIGGAGGGLGEAALLYLKQQHQNQQPPADEQPGESRHESNQIREQDSEIKISNGED